MADKHVPDPFPIPLVAEHGVPSAEELQRHYERALRRSQKGRVAQSTYDAVRVALYQYGMSYPEPEWLMTRLTRMSAQQNAELLAWIDRRNANWERDHEGHPISAEVRELVARCKP